MLLIGQPIEESPANLFLKLPAIPSEWQFIIGLMPIQIAAERLARLAGRDCDSFRLCVSRQEAAARKSEEAAKL